MPPEPKAGADVNVPIGRWAVAGAPTRLATLLGSCVGVVLHDRVARVGGIAHVVLPEARGVPDHPGKYADTAVPALLRDLEHLVGSRVRSRLTAKLFGGANMFATVQTEGIGERNQKAVEQALAAVGVPILARDLGGGCGRRVVLDTGTGVVIVRVPGRSEYQI